MIYQAAKQRQHQQCGQNQQNSSCGAETEFKVHVKISPIFLTVLLGDIIIA